LLDSPRRLRTAIVDDEPLARRLLRALLDDVETVELVAECRNGREAIEVTRSLAPDLLILDVQMPGVTGFDVVRELQADLMPAVIFCTAYQRYAIDAFDLHAVDYLLKPVSGARLERAIARALQRLAEGGEAADNKTPLMGAIDEIANKVFGRTDNRRPTGSGGESRPSERKLAIKDHSSTVLVEMDDIDWVDAAGDYMCVHVKGETLIMRSTLKDLMAKLDADRFRRIHRSTLVNLDRIVKVTSLRKGEYMLKLDCDQELKVSRNYRQAIRRFLDES